MHNNPVAIVHFTSYMHQKGNTENNDKNWLQKIILNKKQESMLPVSLSEKRQNGGFA